MELSIIQNKIHEIRGHRVMLDFDLAEMYEVETKVLKQSIRRNINRFPEPDFMFELSQEEWKILRSQFVTSRFNRNIYPSFYPHPSTKYLHPSTILKSY